MVAAVVLDHKARLAVVEISPTNEPLRGIVEIGLDFGSGQSGLHQNPAQTRFHWGFGGPSQQRERAQTPRTRPAVGSCGELPQSDLIGKPLVNGHVDRDQGFYC